MAVELQAPPESAGVSTNGATLVATLKGIIDDFQTLLQQQFAMIRAEVLADWTRTKTALWPLALGAALFLIGVPLLCVMLVYLIHYLNGAPDPARIPLWACYGIVGTIFTLASIVMMLVGIKRFQSFNPLPDETARALQENVQWLTKKT